MNTIRTLLALPLLALALFAPLSLGAPDEPQISQAGNVRYVSGGVSEEGRERMASLGRTFNLKLVFSTKSGAYLSDVGIIVIDARGERLLDTRADGPLFYAELPTGTYQIEASANGKTLLKSVAVAAQGQNKIDLRWDD